MNINFKIPVDLFDFRESENSLYSYAKLKIFYVGMTQDKRLFTKKFSDNLLKSLPYVPVVGYYDEEDEDFKGHNPEIQHIYGVVPEDTELEYIEEDGKEYAVCDVILYTGRTDKTGQIAQKIVGKPHSLELNPSNTTYKINRNKDGEFQNIEFKTGTLLGLSILGSQETPAFAGAGFFNENSQYKELFEAFKKELDKFTNKKGQRGEKMDENSNINVALDPEVEEVFEVVEEVITEAAVEEVAAVIVEDAAEEVFEEVEVEEEVTQTVESEEIRKYTEKEFFEKFMRVTEDELLEGFVKAVDKRFGEVHIVQFSMEDKLVVFFDYAEWTYNRSTFERKENETFEFGNPELVKIRFLTNEEIDKLWSTEQFRNTEENGTIFSENNEGNDIHEELDADKQISEQVVQTKEEEQHFAALNNSERAELEAFRREKKVNLISGFQEDLGSEFLSEIEKNIDVHSYEELDTILSKEFTRITRSTNKKNKPNTFAYTRETQQDAPQTESELIAELVSKYKTRN